MNYFSSNLFGRLVFECPSELFSGRSARSSPSPMRRRCGKIFHRAASGCRHTGSVRSPGCPPSILTRSPSCPTPTSRYLRCFSVLWIWIFWIRIQHLKWIRIQIQCFDDQKLEKKQLKKLFFFPFYQNRNLQYLSLSLLNLQSPKEKMQYFLTFLYFLKSFFKHLFSIEKELCRYFLVYI